ncbi:MAG: hypothetical protein VYD90_10415 [Pseudomonadota bacterium]|nr:hypothetical protein [Pseudomonadota bacterium]
MSDFDQSAATADDTPPHVQRMKCEFDDLAERCSKLLAFLDTSVFEDLATLDQDLLVAQHTAMVTYLSILNIRLKQAGHPQH